MAGDEMLQYFFNNKYNSLFDKSNIPKLEYFCKVGSDSSRMPRAMHEHKHLVEILLVYGGSGIYTINKQRYNAIKGDLILYNSSVIHEEQIDKSAHLETYCLGISNLKLPQLSKDKIIKDDICPIIPTGEHYHRLLTIMELIDEAIKQEHAYSNEHCNHLMQALVVDVIGLVDKYSKAIVKDDATLAWRIQEYIDAYYSEDISLDSIAEAVNANRFYLSHVFKAATGFSPRQYIIKRRIGEAQNLLINTNMNITKIATSVGYNNSNYFQNVFRDTVGFTPGEYRRKWRD